MTGDMLSQNIPVSFQCPPADTLLLAARGADVSHVVIHSATVILSGLDMFAGIAGSASTPAASSPRPICCHDR